VTLVHRPLSRGARGARARGRCGRHIPRRGAGLVLQPCVWCCSRASSTTSRHGNDATPLWLPQLVVRGGRARAARRASSTSSEVAQLARHRPTCAAGRRAAAQRVTHGRFRGHGCSSSSSLFALLGSGVWIGLALSGVAWIGMELFTTRPAGDAMAVTIWGAASSLDADGAAAVHLDGRDPVPHPPVGGHVPRAGAVDERLPGRLLHTNIIGCTIFAAVSGSSAATCATIGKMTLPELGRAAIPRAW
jgi:hypothetical protein